MEVVIRCTMKVFVFCCTFSALLRACCTLSRHSILTFRIHSPRVASPLNSLAAMAFPETNNFQEWVDTYKSELKPPVGACDCASCMCGCLWVHVLGRAVVLTFSCAGHAVAMQATS